MSMRLAAAVLAVSFAIGGCSGTQQPRQLPTQAAPPPRAFGAPTVEPAKADFFLTVSNQSFKEPLATITVTIDGNRAIDERFDVGSQHSFKAFPFALGPGRHVLSATAASGARREATFDLPMAGDRYGILQYWSDGVEAPYFSWQLQTERPVFG